MSAIRRNALLAGVSNLALGTYNIANAALPDNSTGYWSITLTTSATHSGSVWVQRVDLGVVEPVLDGHVYFNASDQLVVNGLTSTAVYRDTTAPLHIFWNASGAWVNGVSVTGTGSYATSSITNPRWAYDGTNFAGMYFADHAFWDGSSETLNGGEESSTTGNWIASAPASPDYTIADWTEQGTITQVTSTPTNVYATWNPLDQNVATVGSFHSYTSGNTTFTGTSGGVNSITRATLQMQGLTYFECTPTSLTGVVTIVGIARASANIQINGDLNGITTGCACIRNDRNVYLDGVLQGTPSGTNFSANDTCGVAFNPLTGDLWFGRIASGGSTITWLGSGDPVAGTGAHVTGLTEGDWIPTVHSYASNAKVAGFEEQSFNATNTPAGFEALTTDNLPAMVATDKNVDDHFVTKTWTGTGATNKITTGFPVHFSWTKTRGVSSNHCIMDAVRGVDNYVSSNTTAAENTIATLMDSFDSDGITFGADTASLTNTNTDTMVGWFASLPTSQGNTDGSITVSAGNQRVGGAGFEMSITEFTGTGANATVGHGLSKAPDVVILKSLDNGAGATNWPVYHSSIGPTKRLKLDTTDATQTSSTFWQDTAPTSTVVSIGTDAQHNYSGDRYLMICFAECDFIKIGSYTNNNNANGPMLSENMLMSWGLFKPNASASWYMWDKVRNPYNPAANYLLADSSAAEGTASHDIDINATGVKLRTALDPNYLTNTTVYLMIGQPTGASNADEAPGR